MQHYHKAFKPAYFVQNFIHKFSCHARLKLLSASKMTYIVSGGALYSTHSLTLRVKMARGMASHADGRLSIVNELVP